MTGSEDEATDDQVPAWARRTTGESRLAATVAVLGIIVLQVLLPEQFSPQPWWLLPVLESLLLIVLFIGNPVRIDREERWLRMASLALTTVLGIATGWSVCRLVLALIDGRVGDDPAVLLGSGGAIWLTNVITFALWYWEYDRGGPAARAHARKPFPDFMFVQMQNPDLTDPTWEPEFADYLYLSFTNATAFSPTDVLPMSRPAKSTMMLEAAISVTTMSLVIARAVNVLR